MKRWGMAIDLERCVGCQTCTMTCKVENSLPPGTYWARVLKEEIGTYPNARMVSLPVLCMHCEEPPCVPVCPTGASRKREDGIVWIDYDTCIGCRYCMQACPYEARNFHADMVNYLENETPYERITRTVLGKGPQQGTVSKCNFCMERVDAGRDPACVETCLGKARIFGDLNDPASEVAGLLRDRDHAVLHPEAGTRPSVFYLTEIDPSMLNVLVAKFSNGTPDAAPDGTDAPPGDRSCGRGDGAGDDSGCACSRDGRRAG